MAGVNFDLPVFVQRDLLAEQFASSVSFNARSDAAEIQTPYQAAYRAWDQLISTTGLNDQLSVKGFVANLFQDEVHRKTFSLPSTSMALTLNRHLIVDCDQYGVSSREDVTAIPPAAHPAAAIS